MKVQSTQPMLKKRLRLWILPLALSLGLFSANVSQAQYTNAYWDVNGTTNGQGGSGTFSSSGVLWTTNDVNATANTGGPINGGLFSLVTGAAGTATLNNSGGYNINFGGTAGSVKQGGSYQAASVNFLTSGYSWWADGNGARTITTSNGVNLNGNALTLSNGPTGINSFTFTTTGATTFTSNIASTNAAITGTAGASLTLKNDVLYTPANTFSVYVNGWNYVITNVVGSVTNKITNTVSSSISANTPIIVDIAAGSKIFLGTSSSQGGIINANITNNSASGVALNITNNNSGTVAFNGVISGARGLVLDNTGSGTITLAASNTYAGGTIVNGTGTGSIRLANSSALGTGQLIISDGATSYIRAQGNDLNFANAVQIGSGATLQLAATNGNHKSTWSGVISGAGGINYNYSDNGLYLTGTNSSFGGGVNVSSSGTLFVSKLGMAGANSSIGTNGTITISPSGTTGAGKVRWTGSADEISDKNFALTTVSSGASAGVQILADGATNATLTLNGNINSTGINNKVITLAGYNTNKLILNGTINETANYTNSVVIGVSSSGTVVLGNTNNSFSGAVSIGQGTAFQSTVLETAQIGSNGVNSTLGKNGTINIGSSDKDRVTALRYVGAGETSDKVINLSGTTGGAILEQAGTGNLKFTSAMTATGVGAKAITLQGSTAGTGELAGAISDLGGNVISLNKYGSGDWTLSGNNSYSGLTTVSGAGSLMKLMATGALSAKTSLAGESAQVSAGTIDFGVGGSYTANSYGTLSDAGNNMYFTNSSGNAVTLTFTNANNYVTGSTGGGKTLVNSSSSLNLDFDGNIEIGSTATNTTTFRGAGSFNVDGNLLDTGANGVRTLQKDGQGTLTLRGSGNNYRGSTLVQGGTLEVAESGVLPVTNSITVSSGATLKFNKPSGEISVGAMTVAGTLEQNLVTITSSGAVDLTGSTLMVNEPPTADEYILVRGNSVIGTPNLSGADGYELKNENDSIKLVKTVVVSGSTFDTTYSPGSEEAVGPNGLKNLMNYALGGTALNPSPDLPVLTIDANGLTLTANIRNDDNSGLTVDGEYADSLEGPWTKVKQEEWNPDANSSVPNLTVKSFTRAFGSQPRQFLRFRVTK